LKLEHAENFRLKKNAKKKTAAGKNRLSVAVTYHQDKQH